MKIRQFVSRYIGENTKDVIKTTLIIVLIVVVIVGSVQLFSMTRKDTTQTYVFTTSAQTFHNRLDESSLQEDFQFLSKTIDETKPDSSSDLDLLIRDALLSYSAYGDQFTWLYPTMDSLDLFESLLREGRLVSSCFSRLNRAWTSKKAGDELSSQEHLNVALDYYNQAIELRAQNKELISDLLAKTGMDLDR